MICNKCNKFYLKRKYYEDHVKRSSCIRFLEKSIPSTIIEPPKKIEKIEKLEKKSNHFNLYNTYNNVDEEIDDLKMKFDQMIGEINALKDKIKELEKYNKNDENKEEKQDTTKIVKKERMNIDDEIVKEHLNPKTLESDCELLYKYYFENIKKNLYPIKKEKKSDCYYWNGTDWVEDINGNNLKVIFTSNLKKVYTRVNNSKDPDYLINQEYINELSSKKHQNHLYNYFLDTYL